MTAFPNCYVVVDGSNVAARPNGVPALNRLLIVRDALSRLGCPSIDLIVDPTLKAARRLAERDGILLREMIRNNDIIEATNEADPWIINRAKNRDGFIVSNDLFRDCRGIWPILPARLIRFDLAETGCTFQTPRNEMINVEIPEGPLAGKSSAAVPTTAAPRTAGSRVSSRYKFTRLDDLVALYLYKCRNDDLGPLCRGISTAIPGMKERSLRMRVRNVEYIDWRGGVWERQRSRPPGPGLKNYARQSWEVYRDSAGLSCEKLRGKIDQERPGLPLD